MGTILILIIPFHSYSHSLVTISKCGNHLVKLQKYLRDFKSLNTVSHSKVSSGTWGNLFIVTPYKRKRQIIYFQHRVSYNMHCHSKIEEPEHTEETLDQSKTQTPNPMALCSMSKGWDGSTLPALLTETQLPLLRWFCSLCAALLGR